MYRTRLQRMRVKGAVYLPDFRKLIQQFLDEGSDSKLLATVFVSANVAFLAVPESYLYHVRHLGEHIDLTITACFLSLPVVSLLWLVLCFNITIAAFCVQKNNTSSKIILVILLSLLGFFASVTLLFFWHIWRSPRHNEEFNMDTILNIDPLKGLPKAEMAVMNLIKSLKMRTSGQHSETGKTNEQATRDEYRTIFLEIRMLSLKIFRSGTLRADQVNSKLFYQSLGAM
ncbi:hypothetical protein EDD22DRAFT_852178 [Suillus occidentalis]|nr:hypothetical protein EDD22DRAFT_852178 [Suillus occidentalis]